MHLVNFLVFATFLVATLGDCGCLQCSKHLRIISAPHSPVTVIERRGETCVCPKPVPYHIEIPVPPQPLPRKDYGYKVQKVEYVQHQEPVVCQHGYRIEIPYLPAPQPHTYHQGLLAKTDRIVVSARDECVPPKPNCCNDPIIEYIQPDCDYNCCRNHYIYSGCHRRKRDLYQDRTGFRGATRTDWNKILTPKTIRSSNAKNPWEKRVSPSVLPKPNAEDLFAKIRRLLRKNPNQKYVRHPSKIIQKEPLRLSIPLPSKPNNHFFPPAKSPKAKRKTNSQYPFVEYPVETDPRSERYIGSKTFTKLLEKSAKFADVDNVKITIPQTRTHRQRSKKDRQYGSRKIRSTTFEIENPASQRIDRNPIESGDRFRKDFSENSIVDNARMAVENRFSSPARSDQVSYVLDTPNRVANHINRMKGYVTPMIQSIPKTLDSSRIYIMHLGKRFRRGTVDFFKNFIGNVKSLPRMIVSGLTSSGRRHKRYTDTKDPKLSMGNHQALLRKQILNKNQGDYNNDPKEDSKSSRKTSKIGLQSNFSNRIVRNEIDKILDHIQQLNDKDFNVDRQIHEELSKLQFRKDSLVAILKDFVTRGELNDPDAKIPLLRTMNKILSSNKHLEEMLGKILAYGRNFSSSALVRKLVSLEKLQFILAKLFRDFSEDGSLEKSLWIDEMMNRIKWLEQLNLGEEKSKLEVQNALKERRNFEIKKEIMILKKLKMVLECQNTSDQPGEVEKIAETLWQINHCKKLWQNTISEMNNNIQNGLPLTKELKIVFDLEKQIRVYQTKLFALLCEDARI